MLSGSRPVRWGAGTITMTGHLSCDHYPRRSLLFTVCGIGTTFRSADGLAFFHETADHAASNYTLLLNF